MTSQRKKERKNIGREIMNKKKIKEDNRKKDKNPK